MPEYYYDNLATFLNSWQENNKYFDMLRLMAQLSKLFSDSDVPYLDYRLAENLFCKYYSAQNDARSCTAYDARISHLGIGIKTFVLNSSAEQSTEKIAEFNKLKKTLNDLHGIELARKLGAYRNERMASANKIYDVTETQYHIVGRSHGLLRIFNVPYEEVDIEHIHLDKDDDTSCAFHDEKNEYTFNKSKSVLMKRFYVPKAYKDVKVDIIEYPLAILEKMFSNGSDEHTDVEQIARKRDYVELPLYSFTKKKGYYVPEKSGLNQFNAGGRKRDELEVYIPVPKRIHKEHKGFFPNRNEPFTLYLPNGNKMSAKICQDGDKALMSNPNTALGKWLLRDILNKAPQELVTMDDLNELGFNSVCVENLHHVGEDGLKEYKISLFER